MVHDGFTVTELVSCEDLGFCKKGQAKEHIEKGTFASEGKLPINPDGGLLSFGHPLSATGIRMLYEIYKQLQGKAAPSCQLSNVEIGLAHSIGGEYPNVSSVAILSTR